MFAIRFRCTAHNKFLIPPMSLQFRADVIQETLVTEKFGWHTINLRDWLCPDEHLDEKKLSPGAPGTDLYYTCRTTGQWAIETQTMMDGVDDPRDEEAIVRTQPPRSILK